jgi:site-specific DNA-methyltransferase (adenine-specific)
MKPFYEDDHVTIFHGDSMQIIDGLEWDHVLTDPPYGIAYEGGPTNLGATEYAPIHGDDTFDAAQFALTIPAQKRVVFGAHEFPHLLGPGGQWFCWDKRLTEAADKMVGTPYELAWSDTPGKNQMLRVLHGGVVNANRNGPRMHPTEKPISMLMSIIETIPEGVILDPFMGSGTTLRAAKNLGRKAIGVEIEERYCYAAAERMGQEVLTFGDDL